MKYYYDMHIHSCLSGCADVLNSPNNILNMAYIKKLDIISVTDHNSLKQVPILYEIAKSYNLIFIPGVEITVNEGFHVLVYLKKIDDVLKLDAFLEKHLIKEELDLKKYNKQVITDIYDNEESSYPYLLSNPIDLGIKELIEYLKEYDHLLFFAHIDKRLYSGKKYLDDVEIDGVEVMNKDYNFSYKNIIHNSDAHTLIHINEQDNYLELDELSIDALFEYFRGKKNA